MYYYYHLMGFIFRSSIEIAQLMPAISKDRFDVELIIGKVPEEIHQEIADKNINNNVNFTEDYIWMRNIYGIFAVYKTGKIYVEDTSGSDPLFLLQFVFGYGISMFAHLHDMVALHCGSVSINGKAIVITGASGAGKSTLTTELIEEGAKMISDDVVAVGFRDQVLCAYPAFPQQKLCRDAAIRKGYKLEDLIYIDPGKDKFAIKRHKDFITEPQKLHTFFALEWYDPNLEENKKYNGEVITEELSGFNKLEMVVKQLFIMALLRISGLPAKQFQLCVDIAANVPIVVIKRPEKSDTMNEVKKCIYKIVGEENA